MRPFLPAILMFLPGLAMAVPIQLQHQGRLLDSVGEPIHGRMGITVALCDAASGGSCPIEQVDVLDVDNGYYAMAVGSSVTLDHTALLTLEWVEVRVNGVAVGQRTRLTETGTSAMTLSIVPDSITGAEVVDGSLTAADVDTSSIQRRISGTCGGGTAVTSIGANGTVTCASAGETATLVTKRNNGSPQTTSYVPDRYIVEANQNYEGIVVPFDNAIFDALCRDDDGCEIVVGMVNWSSSVPGAVASRKEHFFLSQTGNHWRFANTDVEAADNNNSINEWTPWDCYFTDAETSTNTNNGRADLTRGFGLLNVRGGGYPDDRTTCRVIITD